jgi:hypothetical protein
MEGMYEIGWMLILLVFIVGVIVTTVMRVRNREDSWYGEVSSSVAAPFLSSAFIIGLILAFLCASFLSDHKDTGAIYYIRGVVIKGGTNWLYVFGAWFIGFGVAQALICLISAIPLKISYLFSEQFRQDRKALLETELKSGIERKKVTALILSIFFGIFGIHWFYLKMWQFGIAQIIFEFGSTFIVRKLLTNFESYHRIIIEILLCIPWLIGIVFVAVKKEVVLNGRRIVIK